VESAVGLSRRRPLQSDAGSVEPRDDDVTRGTWLYNRKPALELCGTGGDLIASATSMTHSHTTLIRQNKPKDKNE